MADPLSLNLYTYCAGNPIKYWDPTGHSTTAVTVTLPNGKTAQATITDGKTTMANGGSPPLGSTVHAANGKDYYVTSSGGVEVKSTGTATVTTTSSQGKVSTTNAVIVNGSTYINGVRPSAGSIVTVHSNDEMFIVASDGKGGVKGQQITSASQVSILNGTVGAVNGVVSGWLVVEKSTSNIMTYQYNGVPISSHSFVVSSTGFRIGNPAPAVPAPIQTGAQAVSKPDIFHEMVGDELNVANMRDVLRVQSCLAELGYLDPFHTSTTQKADGDFGSSTEAAVKAFQKKYGLEDIGTVDKAIWDAIQKEYYRTAAYTDQSVSMIMPVNLAMSGTYGWRTTKGQPDHQGLDFGTQDRTGIQTIASVAGKVVFAGHLSGRGNTVIIQSDQNPNIYVLYQHLAKTALTTGNMVSQAQKVGTIGKTGGDYPIHLHYEVLINPEFKTGKDSDGNTIYTNIYRPSGAGYSKNPWLFLP